MLVQSIRASVLSPPPASPPPTSRPLLLLLDPSFFTRLLAPAFFEFLYVAHQIFNCRPRPPFLLFYASVSLCVCAGRRCMRAYTCIYSVGAGQNFFSRSLFNVCLWVRVRRHSSTPGGASSLTLSKYFDGLFDLDNTFLDMYLLKKIFHPAAGGKRSGREVEPFRTTL